MNDKNNENYNKANTSESYVGQLKDHILLKFNKVEDYAILKSRSTKKPERIVFGIGIGPDMYYKNPAEAFFGKLYDFETSLDFATDESERLDILHKQKLFIDTFHEELLPNEDPKKLLESALMFGQSKIASCQEEIVKEEAEMNEDKGFITALGRPYVDKVGRDILDTYERVTDTIHFLVEPVDTVEQDSKVGDLESENPEA